MTTKEGECPQCHLDHRIGLDEYFSVEIPDPLGDLKFTRLKLHHWCIPGWLTAKPGRTLRSTKYD